MYLHVPVFRRRILPHRNECFYSKIFNKSTKSLQWHIHNGSYSSCGGCPSGCGIPLPARPPRLIHVYMGIHHPRHYQQVPNILDLIKFTVKHTIFFFSNLIFSLCIYIELYSSTFKTLCHFKIMRDEGIPGCNLTC